MTAETVVVLISHALLAPATALHALLFKRDSRAAFGWIVVCILFPLAGPLIYLFFGLNRARGRAQKMGLDFAFFVPERGGPLTGTDQIAQPKDPQTHHLSPHEPTPSHDQDIQHPLRQAGQSLSRHPAAPNSGVCVFEGGEATFQAMLEAIDAAKHQILIATYIFDRDPTGQRFVDALAEAVKRGIEVFVIIDGVGRLYSRPPITSKLIKAGVHVGLFLPPKLLPPSLSINMRSHHKIFLVDGEFAMTGGINISHRHLLTANDNRHPTNDLHFQLSGPVIDQLRAEFDRLWKMTTAYHIPLPQPIEGDTPISDQALPIQARVITDGPDEDLDRLTMLFIAALSQARTSVRIMTPYFLPPRELVSAIQAASIRGVDVVLVLPSNNNLAFVHWATQNMLWELLFRGVKVYYQAPPFHHGKLLVVDDAYTVIGSSNWDTRSLRLNFELQVEAYGREFGGAMRELVDRAAASGREVTLDEVDSRRFWIRLRDSICWLFSPYL